jgi:hypothetical protein
LSRLAWIGGNKQRTKAESVSSTSAKTVSARAHIKDSAKNKRLLSAFVERTDVINLYATRVGATFVFSFFDDVGSFLDDKRMSKQVQSQ